ncbi:MAG: BrnT family toxin [Elusimicrobiota bacterium]|nr:BrnT family toxin [Elusimicrobiota bacterium]
MKLEKIAIKEFDWDPWNRDKIRERHGVEVYECEEVFFNRDLKILPDEAHSITEKRFYAYGMTDDGRLLFIVFTIRRRKIRMISARNMNKKERRWYHEKIKKDS